MYSMYGMSSSYIVYCPLYGRCPLFRVSAKRGSTVVLYACDCSCIIKQLLHSICYVSSLINFESSSSCDDCEEDIDRSTRACETSAPGVKKRSDVYHI